MISKDVDVAPFYLSYTIPDHSFQITLSQLADKVGLELIIPGGVLEAGRVRILYKLDTDWLLIKIIWVLYLPHISKYGLVCHHVFVAVESHDSVGLLLAVDIGAVVPSEKIIVTQTPANLGRVVVMALDMSDWYFITFIGDKVWALVLFVS